MFLDYLRHLLKLVVIIKLVFTTDTFVLTGVGTEPTGIGSDGVTGIVTYFNINGRLEYPEIKENDILE